MTTCTRPVGIDASIAAKVPIASMDTSTARIRGCAAAASTQATLEPLMRKKAHVTGSTVGRERPCHRGGRSQSSASVTANSICRSAIVNS